MAAKFCHRIKIDYNWEVAITPFILYSIYLTNADPNTAYFYVDFFGIRTLNIFWHSTPAQNRTIYYLLPGYY
jgi:hypothetical protein